MKHFLQGVAAFLAPVLLVGCLFGAALYRSGEWRTEEEIAARVAAGEPAFLGLAHRDNRQYYKHLTADSTAASLLVLGSSRTMQFSEKMFTGSFYNAGGGANYITEYRFFLENLREDALPEILLVGLDQYYFQDKWAPREAWPEFDYGHYPFRLSYSFRRIVQDYGMGKFRLRDMLNPPPDTYGIAAVGRGSGFRADGSYSYGTLMDHPETGTDVGFHDSFDRIDRGVNRFEWADTVYAPALEELGLLAEFCADHDIQMVAFLPPYAPSVYQRMVDSGHYGYLNELPAAASAVLAPYGFALYDYTCLPDTADAEYVDGYHGGDRVYARIAQLLARDSAILADRIDTDYLARALAPTDSPLRLAA